MSAHKFWKLVELSLTLGLSQWAAKHAQPQISVPSALIQRYPQREQSTDEVPVQRVEQAVRYPLHQHEDEESNRQWKRWLAEQEVLHQRFVEPTATGPRDRNQLGHVQKIIPHVAAYQPPQPHRVRLTGDMQRVTGPHTPLPATQPNPLQLLSQDDLPDWMSRPLPGQRFPVRRAEPTGDLLATMRPRSRYELEKPPVDELPTVPDVGRLSRDAMNALPPWQAPVIPPAVQNWIGPAEPDFTENQWLNEPSAVVPPVLKQLTNNDPAAGDKLAISARRETDQPTSALTELAALAVQPPTEETAQVPNAMRERAIQLQQRLRESE